MSKSLDMYWIEADEAVMTLISRIMHFRADLLTKAAVDPSYPFSVEIEDLKGMFHQVLLTLAAVKAASEDEAD